MRATITIDPKLHARAKRLARQRRTTVSGLIEAMILEQADLEEGSLVDRMVGSGRLRPAGKTPDPLRDALQEKYLRE